MREDHKELGDKLGSCPLSVMDLFEALEAGSAMCLALDVERSEGCIADPSLLKIKAVIPTFMSSDAFIDSSIFSLKKDDEAHGGFSGHDTNNKDAALAMGVGRENITGVLPLYLFKEHWAVARRRAPPIFGLMCTLDVMGYASSQQFTIPFKVLLKVLENVEKDPSEMNKFVLKLVLETCQALIDLSPEFRKNLIKQLSEFIQKAESRTTDVVSSIQILIA